MEIGEKTKISLGFLVVALGGIGTAFAKFFKLEARTESLEDDFEDLSEQVSKKLDQLDDKLFEIQKILINMSQRK